MCTLTSIYQHMDLNSELWSQVDVPLERALDRRRLCLSGPRDGAPLVLCGGVAGAGVAASDGPGAKAEAYEARGGYRGDLLAGALSLPAVSRELLALVALACVLDHVFERAREQTILSDS